jgi:hypothetical protein
MIGAILGLTARPLLESLMHLASSLRQDALGHPAQLDQPSLGLSWHGPCESAAESVVAFRVGPGVVGVTAFPFHYAAECEACGNSAEISYADLRRELSRTLPDKTCMERSLICACGAAAKGSDDRPKLLRLTR